MSFQISSFFLTVDTFFGALNCFDDWNDTVLQDFVIATTHMAFVNVSVACKILYSGGNQGVE